MLGKTGTDAETNRAVIPSPLLVEQATTFQLSQFLWRASGDLLLPYLGLS